MWWEAGRGELIMPDTQGWLIILYAGLFPSLISQILYIKGVEGIGANRAGLFINLVPVFAVLQAAVLLDERLGLVELHRVEAPIELADLEGEVLGLAADLPLLQAGAVEG